MSGRENYPASGGRPWRDQTGLDTLHAEWRRRWRENGDDRARPLDGDRIDFQRALAAIFDGECFCNGSAGGSRAEVQGAVVREGDIAAEDLDFSGRGGRGGLDLCDQQQTVGIFVAVGILD